MKDETRSIFRAEAVQRYTRGKDRATLPRFTPPRTALLLLALSALLLGGGAAAWYAQFPVYASGVGVVLDAAGAAPAARGGMALALFLPAEDLPSLRAGQNLFVVINKKGDRVSGTITSVEPEVSSPDASQKRFGLNAGASAAVSRPAAVAFTSLQAPSANLPPGAYAGSVYRVDVEVGRSRLVAHLPFVSRFVRSRE